MKYITPAVACLFVLASCISNKKITGVRNSVNDFKGQQGVETAQLKTLDNNADARLAERKIDSNIRARILKRLDREKATLDSAQMRIALLEGFLKEKRLVRKNYKKVILPTLDSLQQQKNKYAERLSVYMMIQNSLDIADFKLFDLAAFFGPGKYSIPEDKTDLAVQSFSPIVDSLIIFSNKYYTKPRTATLVILGFADGMGITPGSGLYDTLINAAHKTEAGKPELNMILSELRAKELIKQLTNVFLKKADRFINFDKLNIVYIGQGKGEEFPLPSIHDYKEDDDRRRIVLCYWIVLPD
jgi:hypothetical protein